MESLVRPILRGPEDHNGHNPRRQHDRRTQDSLTLTFNHVVIIDDDWSISATTTPTETLTMSYRSYKVAYNAVPVVTTTTTSTATVTTTTTTTVPVITTVPQSTTTTTKASVAAP